MAKGLTDKRRTEIFEDLNMIFEQEGISEKLRETFALEKVARHSRRSFSDLAGIPTEEDERFRFLSAALEAHDHTEPSYSALCTHMCWTIWLCGKNRSSEQERGCAAHVVEAFRAKRIEAGDIPMDSLGGLLSSHINFHMEFPDKSDAEIGELFAWCEGLIDDGLFDRREWYELRATHAVSKGSFAEAERYIGKFLETPRSKNSDCEGCELDRLVKNYLKMNDMAKAAHYVDTILNRKLKCESDIPEKTRIQHALTAQFVSPDRDSPKKLMKLLEKAGKDLYPDKYLIFEAALYICAARNLNTYLNTFEAANTAIEMFRPVADEYPYEAGIFHFYLAAYSAKSQGGGANAEEWLEKARTYAKAFDARNGNEYYRRTIESATSGGGLWRLQS